MRAGEMRHRVVLQRRLPQQDGSGQQLDYWEDQMTVWAAVEPSRGREFFASEKFVNEISTVVKMRYHVNVDETWRIKRQDPGNTQYWAILGIVRPYLLKRDMYLACRELTTGEPIR
jgi:SPP1 family predicted phage head-tail adaptor